MHCKLIALSTSALICLSACQQQPEVRGCNDATVTGFQALIQNQYVDPFKAGDIDSWLEIFSDSASGLHNRVPALIGREAIAGFGQLVSASFIVEEMTVVVEEVDASGNWAFTRGRYTSHLLDRQSGESAPWGREQGKFFMLWTCEPQGQWRIRVDMGNGDA